MRASWSALHASFVSALNRTSAATAFTAMRQVYPELAHFPSIAEVMEHQHNLNTDAATRFGVIRALVVGAQSEHRHRPTAQIMVILALWPGLDAVFWRLWSGFPGAREDLSGEIISRISNAILTIDLHLVSAVTATLLRNLERDVRRDLIRARQTSEAVQPISDPVIDTRATMLAWFADIDAQPFDDHLAELASRDAHLLKRVFLLGETQEEAGRALGLRPAAARKRFQRALEKLRSRRKILSGMSH